MLIDQILMGGLQFLSALFIFVVGTVLAIGVVIFVIDVRQTTTLSGGTTRSSADFVTCFRCWVSFFASISLQMDREEMPFNRAEREWIGSSSEKADNTVAFGSTRSLTPVGTPIFVNYPFPTLTEDAVAMLPMLIGPYSRNPYNAPSFFNISGMSYGALSTPAFAPFPMGQKWRGSGTTRERAVCQSTI